VGDHNRVCGCSHARTACRVSLRHRRAPARRPTSAARSKIEPQCSM
jgi:hypothetical protein